MTRGSHGRSTLEFFDGNIYFLGLLIASSVFSYLIVGSVCKKFGLHQETTNLVTSVVMVVCLIISVGVLTNIT